MQPPLPERDEHRRRDDLETSRSAAPTPDHSDQRLIDAAADLASREVLAGGVPFSALVVDVRGAVIGTGVNTVTRTLDPTAHAEVVALRDAAGRHALASLHGSTLVASGEPCAMCYIVARWSGVGRVIFGVDRHGAARAGFGYGSGYGDLHGDPVDWFPGSGQVSTPKAQEPFEAYAATRRIGGVR